MDVWVLLQESMLVGGFSQFSILCSDVAHCGLHVFLGILHLVGDVDQFIGGTLDLLEPL